jgi:hypothetical protein
MRSMLDDTISNMCVYVPYLKLYSFSFYSIFSILQISTSSSGSYCMPYNHILILLICFRIYRCFKDSFLSSYLIQIVLQVNYALKFSIWSTWFVKSIYFIFKVNRSFKGYTNYIIVKPNFRVFNYINIFCIYIIINMKGRLLVSIIFCSILLVLPFFIIDVDIT